MRLNELISILKVPSQFILATDTCEGQRSSKVWCVKKDQTFADRVRQRNNETYYPDLTDKALTYQDAFNQCEHCIELRRTREI